MKSSKFYYILLICEQIQKIIEYSKNHSKEIDLFFSKKKKMISLLELIIIYRSFGYRCHRFQKLTDFYLQMNGMSFRSDHY